MSWLLSFALDCLPVCLLLETNPPLRVWGILHEYCNRSTRQGITTCHLLNNDDAESGLCFCTDLPCEWPTGGSNAQATRHIGVERTESVHYRPQSMVGSYNDLEAVLGIPTADSLPLRDRRFGDGLRQAVPKSYRPQAHHVRDSRFCGRRSRPGLRRPPELMYITQIEGTITLLRS